MCLIKAFMKTIMVYQTSKNYTLAIAKNLIKEYPSAFLHDTKLKFKHFMFETTHIK